MGDNFVGKIVVDYWWAIQSVDIVIW